jgi:bifunctional non-homologous end joining protein LigD
MARPDGADVRLLTRRGNDWTQRYPLIAAAVNALGVRSCLIDGEAVACGDDGLPAFDRLR